MTDDFLDCELAYAAAAYGESAATVVLQLQQVIPGHEPLQTAQFRFRLGYPMVGEMIDRAVAMVCERNPGLAQAWLREVSKVLAQMIEVDTQSRMAAVDAAEAILHPPDTPAIM